MRLERRLKMMPGYDQNMQRAFTQYENSFEYANEEEMLAAAALYESEMEYEVDEEGDEGDEEGDEENEDDDSAEGEAEDDTVDMPFPQ